MTAVGGRAGPSDGPARPSTARAGPHVYAPSHTLQRTLSERAGVGGVRVIRSPFYVETGALDASVYERHLRGKQYLLFFGSFLNMPQEDYIRRMRLLMEDPEQVYLTMVRNLYTLGHILERKFKLIWMSYTVFLTGLSLAVGIALVLFARWLTTGPVGVP